MTETVEMPDNYLFVFNPRYARTMFGLLAVMSFCTLHVGLELSYDAGIGNVIIGAVVGLFGLFAFLISGVFFLFPLKQEVKRGE